MKIIPVLAITNALALALAIYLYVELGQLRSQSGARRSDPDSARLAGRLDALERQLDVDRAMPLRETDTSPAAADNAPVRIAPAVSTAAQGDAPVARSPEGEAIDPGAADAAAENISPQQMEVFRRRVKKAIDLNNEQEQKDRVIERIDQLVSENKIAPLNAKQKDGVAATVLAYRQKIPGVWRKLQESGTLENMSREDRGSAFRAEFDSLRTEAQHALEEIMPAADAKTYLDETMRDQMRGGFGGGFGGAPAPQAPARPSRTR